MANKFKVGDRVRLLEAVGAVGPPVGSVGTVIEDHPIPFVDWDGFTRGHDGRRRDGSNSCCSAQESRLELAIEQPWEVALRWDEVMFTFFGKTYQLRRERDAWRCYSVPHDGKTAMHRDEDVRGMFANGRWKLFEPVLPDSKTQQAQAWLKVSRAIESADRNAIVNAILQGKTAARAAVEFIERGAAAIRTLRNAGYTYTDGAQLWKPPIGRVGGVTPEMVREALAHLAFDTCGAVRHAWIADRLNAAIADPDKVCECCGVTAAGAIVDDGRAAG